MYQPGTISTPGTSIQGQLLRHALATGMDGAPAGSHRTLPILPQSVTQCGVPAVLPYGNGSLGVFVAGQANSLNSPFSAPWPLSPLYLHTDSQAEEWQLTRLPDSVHGRRHFVSGIPSAILNGEELLVYFNGAQLLEYRCSPDRWWQVSAVPTPDVVVEANPVAVIASGKVFVFSIPGGESLLMCSRSLATAEWQFADLAGEATGRRFDGDPAVVFFGGSLHVFVSANSQNSQSTNRLFELLHFVINPGTLEIHARSLAASFDAHGSTVANSIVGTPSVLASGEGICVFARSSEDRLLEFSSPDGNDWSVARVSDRCIGGDPGSVIMNDGSPLLCAVDQDGHLLQFLRRAGAWQATEISASPNDMQRRPSPVVSGSGLSVFDLKVAL